MTMHGLSLLSTTASAVAAVMSCANLLLAIRNHRLLREIRANQLARVDVVLTPPDWGVGLAFHPPCPEREHEVPPPAGFADMLDDIARAHAAHAEARS